MNAVDLLRECEERKIQLAVTAYSLQVDAPRGVLTPELRAAMAEHKIELLTLLEDENAQEYQPERSAIYDADMRRLEAKRQGARTIVTYRTRHDPDRELLMLAPPGESPERQIEALRERFGDALLAARLYVPFPVDGKSGL